MTNSRSKGARGEVWMPIVGYEGFYEASDRGNVRSIDRKVYHPVFGKKIARKGKVLILYKNPHNGYMYVSLSKNGKISSKRVHILVLKAFSIQEDSSLQVNHKNGIKHDNRLCNLEWITQSQNMKHCFKNKLQKITWNKKVICLDTGIIYESLIMAAKKNGGNKSYAIARVCQGKRSHYKGKVFAYYNDYIKNTIPLFSGKNKRRYKEKEVSHGV